MSKDELWMEITRKAYLTGSQADAIVPLVRDNFWDWSYQRGPMTQKIADKLAVIKITADDIYDRVDDIIRVAKACGCRGIY